MGVFVAAALLVECQGNIHRSDTEKLLSHNVASSIPCRVREWSAQL